MKTKVTVVTVTYNAGYCIEKTIRSVINQDYENIEYIIIDGKSTDDTLEIIEKYKSKIRVLSEPDTGIYNAMNKALKLATGEWIIYMNAGDLFYDNNIISRIFSSDIPNNCALIFASIMVYMMNPPLKKLCIPPICSIGKSRIDLPGYHQATFYRRSVHSSHPYNEEFRIAADYNSMVEILEEGHEYVIMKDICVAWFALDGVSSNLTLAYLKERNIISRSQAPFISLLYQCCKFYIKSIIMRLLPKKQIEKYRERVNKQKGYIALTQQEYELLS